ncbi:MAG: hypothetical protein J2P30_15660 [Actinobacteria bacterium]|nr:hypothetical protein [Actinomycetota bacterium]
MTNGAAEIERLAAELDRERAAREHAVRQLQATRRALLRADLEAANYRALLGLLAVRADEQEEGTTP